MTCVCSQYPEVERIFSPDYAGDALTAPLTCFILPRNSTSECEGNTLNTSRGKIGIQCLQFFIFLAVCKKLPRFLHPSQHDDDFDHLDLIVTSVSAKKTITPPWSAGLRSGATAQVLPLNKPFTFAERCSVSAFSHRTPLTLVKSRSTKCRRFIVSLTYMLEILWSHLINKCFIAGSCVNSKRHVNSTCLHKHTTPCLSVWRTKKWEGNSRAPVINSSLSDGQAAGQ